MKISHCIGLSCLSFVLAGLSYQNSSYAEKFQPPALVSQSATPDNSTEIQAKAEKLVKEFFAQNFKIVENNLNQDLQASFPQEKIKQIWQNSNSKNGSFKRIVKSTTVNTIGSDLVFLTLEFEKDTQDWIIIFNDQQEIIGLDFPASGDIDVITKEFIEYLGNGDFALARIYLNPFLKENIFAQQIQTKWQTVENNQGKFQKIKSINTKESHTDGTYLVQADLQFTKSEVEMLVIFDSSKSIIGVNLFED